MAQAPHPRAIEVERLLLNFYNTKMIEAETGMRRATIQHIAHARGYRFTYISEQERALLSDFRRHRLKLLDKMEEESKP